MLVWNRAKHLLLWFLGIFAWGILACIEKDCFSIEKRAVIIGLEMSPDGHQYFLAPSIESLQRTNCITLVDG